MKATRLRRRSKQPELIASLGVAGSAVIAGAVIGARLRSRSGKIRREAGHERSRPLVGHEFNLMGHSFRILESARDTDDGSLRLDYSAPPDANVSEHVHRFQEERFEVLSGKLGVRVGGQEMILGPGQRGVGPPGIPHAWWNPSGDERVRFLVAVLPGIEVETMFETLLGLMREGRTIGLLPRNPLQLAVLARDIASWLVLTSVEKALFSPVAALAFVGELLGYRSRYPEYSGPDGQAAPVRHSRLNGNMPDRNEN